MILVVNDDEFEMHLPIPIHLVYILSQNRSPRLPFLVGPNITSVFESKAKHEDKPSKQLNH